MTDEEQNQIFAQNLRRLLAESGKQQQDMAAALGILVSTVSNWACGRAMPKMSKIREIADYFDVGISALVEDGAYCQAVKIPVYESISARIPISANTNIVDYEVIPDAMIRSAEYIAMQIHGESMEPRIHDGDVVLVRIQGDAESGDIVVVAIAGKDAECKKIQKRADGIVLMSLNPKYEPMYFANQDINQLPIKMYGKVVEVRGKLKKSKN